ncbi:MAG: hypothetical protein R3F59_18645 [Myxococcota bacterium]
MALHSLGRIDLDDLRLYVGGLSAASPEALEPVVVQAARTAEALGW